MLIKSEDFERDAFIIGYLSAQLQSLQEMPTRLLKLEPKRTADEWVTKATDSYEGIITRQQEYDKRSMRMINADD